ncbi:MAG: O-antigen ligase family protein [Candidatus Magasanikbacteria bacterium]
MFSKLKKYLLQLSLFLLPIQTVYIVQDGFLNGQKWQYGTIVFYLTEIILWIVIMFFVIDFFILFKHKEIKAKKTWDKEKIFSISFLLFLLYLFFNTFFVANNFEIAYQLTRWWMLGFLFFIILSSGFLQIKSILWPLVLSSILPSILGIWQFLTQQTFASKLLGLSFYSADISGVSVVASEQVGRWLRSYGTFVHPNIFGAYLVLVIIAVFFLWQKIDNQKQKIFLYVLLFLQTMSLFFTFSRTAWITWLLFIIFVSVYYIFKKKKILWPVIFSSVFFIILFNIFFTLVQNRIQSNSSYEVKSISERLVGYREALNIWEEHRYLGVGAGNYTLASYELNKNRVGSSYQPVHNIYLLFFVEYGIVGFALFVFVLINFVIYWLSVKKVDQIFFWLILAIIFSTLGLFDHYLLSSYLGFLFLSIFFALIYRLSTD